MYVTSYYADAKVEVNDGVPKGSGYHRDSTQQPPQHDNWPASKVIDQQTAHRSCEQKERAHKN